MMHDPNWGTACVVCGFNDSRALTSVALADGEPAIVCGSHALMHQRARLTMRDRIELRERLRDRRTDSRDRRTGNGYDELASELADAFATDRRGSVDRRRA